ncbi:MAG: peptidoglycan DD-metalloendopeptidase family protein [Sporichthyaceae bacterium]|nr:peptidoglycan DD-metalloendopeptidase family protein [Sporichthyaceae bacterium]
MPVPSAQAEVYAGRPNFQLPYGCGDRYYNSTYAGHDDYDIDMGLPENTPVLASAEGIATQGHSDTGGYQVSIDHGNGWRTLYLHLQAGSYRFSNGALVRQGQHIADSGNTGTKTSGPHLHYEQRYNNAKQRARFDGVLSIIDQDTHSYGEYVTSRNCGTRVISGGAGYFYRVHNNGNMLGYDHSGWPNPVSQWIYWKGGQAIGSGWNQFTQILSDGWTVFGINEAGQLKWYRLADPVNGIWEPDQGKVVGTGWGQFAKVFHGSNGVIYGVTYSGALKWYRYINDGGSSYHWHPNSGTVISSGGWGQYHHLIADNGTIYAVDKNGAMWWYRYTDPLNGAGIWANSGQRKQVGSGWNFAAIGNGRLGIIYAVSYAGQLKWYEHLDPTNGAASWDPASGTVIGTGWV